MLRGAQPVRRRAAVLPLTAILLVVLLGMVAFAVDTGHICTTEAQLQNAADSAALAGASQLLIPYVPGSPSANTMTQNAVNNATAQAQLYAGYHSAGGVTLTLPAGDVVVGYQATPGSGSLTAWATGGTFPNTVEVTTKRTASTNGRLPLFFAPVVGIKDWRGSATAKATCNLASTGVTGFSGSPAAPLPPLLPIAVDNNFWTTFLTTGKSPDGTVYDTYTATLPTPQVQPPNNVSSGADGIPEFVEIYPNATSSGNFGLVSLRNSAATDVGTYNTWFGNGPSATDLSSFGTGGLQATPASPVTMYGGPGLKSVLISTIQAAIGQPRAVPLFSAYTGSGSNMQYTVVGFAGVTIVSATGSGSNISVIVQPMIFINPNVTTKSGAVTGSSFLYPTSPLTLTY